ncbi:MAG: hypothetical protein JW984_16035 [Deltaproteobacteria bacterium]|uniref:Uncharacterized protein n=1 Tax=Candidatus Zymogenus saltonus TaxID=2844893 RepID=A0A9D8KJL2_9DELT|nr:hypothetical protein [Candidatus Zymogenus saltonus]
MAKKRNTSKGGRKSKGPVLLLGGSVALLIVFAIFLAIFVGLLFNYHFLLTDDGFKVVEKIHWGVKDTFADTRDWGIKDWIQHDEVGKALLNSEVDRAKKKWFE